MPYHFVIQGHLGSGKTFLASVLAHWWKEKTEKKGGKIELFSNYELSGSYPMTHYTDWYNVAEAQGGICVWDEAYTAFSNRKWSKYGQGILTDVLMVIRKMKCIQFYCTPSIKFIDSRIRDITEVLITARLVGNKGFEYTFVDYQSGVFLSRHFIPMSRAKKLMNLDLYDTDVIVKHFPVPNTEREGIEFFNKIDEIHNKARMKTRRKKTVC